LKIAKKENKMTQTEATDYGWNAEMSIALQDKIKADLKTALLKKDTEAKSALRLIMSEFPGLTVPITLESGKKTTRLKKPEEITNDDILGIIRKLVKSEKTVLELKKETSSPYLEILERYLPRMATAEEIRAWIAGNVDFSEYKSPLQAMGKIMKHYGKLADGKMVKKILGSM
jgi:uncharacterized protein YqeY